jgi:pimeloyl-ACP methyl ester carboxylesterase
VRAISRKVPALVAVVLVAGLGTITDASAAGGGPAAGAPGAPPLPGRIVRQTVHWHDCRTGPGDQDGGALDAAGARCADITVPLDYAHPGGRTVTVAVSRLAATDTAHRVGSLVLNLGGPATPDLTTPLAARQAMGATGARYDLIGMDPRFTGRSTPLDCHWPDAWLARSAGVDREGFDRTVRQAKRLTDDCVREHADVLPFISTTEAARDMDVVRSALGEPKLSYLGYSYGTYLGALYAQLFPQRADRIVLDSAIDPARPGPAGFPEGGPAREAALHDWAAWAARHDGVYHLGADGPAVTATVERVYRAAARRPLRVGRYLVDDSVFAGALLDPLSDDDEDSDARLAGVIEVFVQALRTGRAEPTPELDATLAGLLTGADSARHSVQTAIMCGDTDVTADPGHYWRDIQRHRAAEPVFGPMVRGITPCAFWPHGHRAAPPEVRNDVPSLVVGADGDVNAVRPMQLAMHHAMGGSRMITLSGVRTHGVYGFYGSTCVDEKVDAYLDTGRLPARDETCGPQ